MRRTRQPSPICTLDLAKQRRRRAAALKSLAAPAACAAAARCDRRCHARSRRREQSRRLKAAFTVFTPPRSRSLTTAGDKNASKILRASSTTRAAAMSADAVLYIMARAFAPLSTLSPAQRPAKAARACSPSARGHVPSLPLRSARARSSSEQASERPTAGAWRSRPRRAARGTNDDEYWPSHS